MNKAGQVQFVALHGGVEQEKSKKILALVGDMVKVSLSNTNGAPLADASIKIEGFGTFSIKETKAKTGTNPLVAGAKKIIAEAAEGKEVDTEKLAKANETMAKVAAGELAETYSKDAGFRLAFKAEKAVQEWLGTEDDEDDDNGGADPVVPVAAAE